MSNRLINETSPYLLQHAHNPVDWYPWGEEALTKARTENKPIIVSIGYSACHWCHVMERESFEKEQVAAVMNADFVCIKVDREERPDVDAIYMDAIHAMGARGGWPLNVFLLPDAKPFYGVTYLPAQNWVQLLGSVKNAFVNHHEELVKSAEGFTDNMLIKETDKYNLHATSPQGDEADRAEASPAPTLDDLHEMFEKIKGHFDTEKGGMDRAPKFPMPSIYKFLLRYYALTQNPEALRHIELSLNRIALGGIYDHVGGGWARYSVDDEWFIPHFEKMLYDNGQLLSIYSEAYTLTKNELYKSRVYETIDWLEREMTSTEGGFYSALDADSEGVEGKFYVWTQAELRSVLGDDFEWFSKLYNIRASGNWEHGYNHLHLTTISFVPETVEKSQWRVGPPLNYLMKGLFEKNSTYQAALQKLFVARESRIRPGLDDKILASWNGLMLKGLTDAYRAFGEEKFKTLALQSAHFLKDKMTAPNHQLWHSYKNGKASIVGFLEDYAAVVDGYLGLYQATFEEQWLDEALKLTAYAIENLYDPEEELFYFTDANAEELIARKKEIFDNVIPASNSLMAHNLFTLGTLFDYPDYVKLSDWMLAKMRNALLTDVQWGTNWAALYALRAQPTAEIAIVGEEADVFRQELESWYVPNKILVGAKTASELPLLQDRFALKGQTTVYVCFNKTCQLPVHSLEDVRKQLTYINE
ncbi:thioredoxin domain-containing protein [Runella slithyformis]|uniref:Spermatogenesis-associated protein 20-like TRX domain-containing protein n=1 Tax=Runella slithyformis (strain ATCC 29530 / DSM 19594 / LMG 11500 / NCIMB 11436 / LSU 4) TaxID=761193 RepID=A0A7U4E7I5_RUNSL|nr:thioredoxin domain-containing protein [Runella slithyformis]AEI50409.1 protein of unknown function DUF255 [Runella slithyformis DSM 19594]